ncbi:ankyrin repeat domain-containing protein 35 isoform X2 [Bombina bombina]|uniref:ankyrin repeat domain-containing protein 35 isoform X2 n=1 Tax=Bombina bombina TaxID=8345 RepID=UPI00235A4974|nr:ankyrin repeat domain-containing protein 35 isoform X2 [Bombina bombina]
MKRIFSCSTPQVPVEKWNRHDQKLFEAVEKGDAKKVSSILSKKLIRPTKISPKGQSAFHLAASRGLTDCLNVIICHKVEINAKTDDGCTALHLAASNCHPDCVKLLLQRGAHEDSIDFHSRTPLHCAAASGCVSSILSLCDSEDTILDAVDDDGRTPLMIAAECNHPTVCSLLLDRGAQVNLTDRDKKTALILACEKGNMQAAETLISKGADLEPKDNKGCDALYYANESRDEPFKKLIQTTLDRRKNEKEPDQDMLSSFKKPTRANSRELELVNMWKKRYDEEQKRGLWLQGEIMTKTQELESMSEEKDRIRELVEKLKSILNEQEGQEATGDTCYTSDICILISQLVQQVKAIQAKQHNKKLLMDDNMKEMSEKSTGTQEMQKRHQDELRCLQDTVAEAQEKEEGALRRICELEGHLENMRDVLSQFEKRKRIQSSVVEELQDQLSEVTNEKEELLTLLKTRKGQDDTLANRHFNESILLQNNMKVLKAFLEEMKTDFVDVENVEGIKVKSESSCLCHVPIGVLEKSETNWKKTISAMEQCLLSIESYQQCRNSGSSPQPVFLSEAALIVNGKADSYEGKSNNMEHSMATYHLQSQTIEASAPCFQSESPSLTLTDRKTSHTLNMMQTQEDKEKTSISTEAKNLLIEKVSEMEDQLSSLREKHENLLTQMNHISQEKQNLEEGLLALQDSLQAEFLLRQEKEIQCKDLKHQILLLSDELSAEQEKLKKLSVRMDSQQSEMLMLRDSFPPEIVQGEKIKSTERFHSDVLEELYWNVGTLVKKYNEALHQKSTLQKEYQRMLENQVEMMPITEHNDILNAMNRKLDMQAKEIDELTQRLSQAIGSIVELKEQLAKQVANSVSKHEHDHHIMGLEKEMTVLKEENEACKEALEKKCEEVIVMKQQLEQEFEEIQVVTSRETHKLQEYERVKQSHKKQLQDMVNEIQTLSDQYKKATEETAYCKEVMYCETEKVVHLENRIRQLETETEELRMQSQKWQEENDRLNVKYDGLHKESKDRENKLEESVMSMTAVIDEQQKKYADMVHQLQDTNKRHQEIISIYRTHLLNAAQGFMDEDVHFTLHWILKMQNDVVF